MADDPTPATAPAAAPAKNWFAKLDPVWRAVLVFAVSTAVSVLWPKLFPGAPAPVIPQPPVVMVNVPGDHPAAK